MVNEVMWWVGWYLAAGVVWNLALAFAVGWVRRPSQAEAVVHVRSATFRLPVWPLDVVASILGGVVGGAAEASRQRQAKRGRK